MPEIINGPGRNEFVVSLLDSGLSDKPGRSKFVVKISNMTTEVLLNITQISRTDTEGKEWRFEGCDRGHKVIGYYNSDDRRGWFEPSS